MVICHNEHTIMVLFQLRDMLFCYQIFESTCKLMSIYQHFCCEILSWQLFKLKIDNCYLHHGLTSYIQYLDLFKHLSIPFRIDYQKHQISSHQLVSLHSFLDKETYKYQFKVQQTQHLSKSEQPSYQSSHKSEMLQQQHIDMKHFSNIGRLMLGSFQQDQSQALICLNKQMKLLRTQRRFYSYCQQKYGI